MKAMTGALNRGGVAQIFLTWQTHAMVAAGLLAMFLLQSALNAGRLVAVQPGLTGADPIVSILWGTVGYGETVRGGVYVVPAVVSAAVIGWGILWLSRSPLISGEDSVAPAPPARATAGDREPGASDRAGAG